MENIGVYQIKINDKTYVGSTTKSFKERLSIHLRKLKGGKHENKHLQNAYNKYGKDFLEFSILEVVKNKEDCIPCEQKWIDKIRPEYNILPKAGSRLGIKATEETKRKLSKSSMGNKNALGYKHTDEAKFIMSQKRQGKTHSKITKMKMSNQRIGNKFSLGFKHTEETKAKRSQSLMGHKTSDETRDKIRQSHMGKKYSDESKAKMSESQKKSVICINTGEIFTSIKEASFYYRASQISKCCRGEQESSGKHPITKEKLLWKYHKE